MKLVIVESPTKSKKLVEYLPAPEYKILACMGHIDEIKNEGMYNLGIDVRSRYEITYCIKSNRIKQLSEIMSACESADEIFIATDPDREGEAIGQAIYKRIQNYKKPTKRIRFHEITKTEVMKAFTEASDIDDRLVFAQEARAALDKIVGWLGSNYLRQTFKENLSAGRVQSVVTRLVVDRENEIKNFEPETYYTIAVRLKKDTEFNTKYEERVTDKKVADSVSAFFADPNTKFIVKSVKAVAKKVNPNPPFTTATLQQHMAKTQKFPLDKTAEVCQKLFESGHITYHRTDSPAISEEALKMVIDHIDSLGLKRPKKPYHYKAKEASAQEAHECIRPTNLSITEDDMMLNKNEILVYTAIKKRFIACQLNPAIYNTLEVKIEGVGDKRKESLHTSGKSLADPGFLEFLEIVDNSSIDIPNLAKSDIATYVSHNQEEKKTKPPSRYSEFALSETLVKMGIGRPGTLPGILVKVIERNYCEKPNEIWHPTETGYKIVKELIDRDFTFMDYKFTAGIEERLDAIAVGEDSYYMVVHSFFTMFKKQLDDVFRSKDIEICRCGGMMIKRKSKIDEREFFGCSNYPVCNNKKDVVENVVTIAY